MRSRRAKDSFCAADKRSEHGKAAIPTNRTFHVQRCAIDGVELKLIGSLTALIGRQRTAPAEIPRLIGVSCAVIRTTAPPISRSSACSGSGTLQARCGTALGLGWLKVRLGRVRLRVEAEVRRCPHTGLYSRYPSEWRAKHKCPKRTPVSASSPSDTPRLPPRNAV